MAQTDTSILSLSETLDDVARSAAPVLVMRMPSKIIVAASPSAHEMLGQIATPVVGRSLEDFIEGGPSGGQALMAAGRISAYESVRVFKATGQTRRIWVRSLGEPGSDPMALATLLSDDGHGHAAVPSGGEDRFAAVIGSADARLMVDRINGEVFKATGWRADEIVGTSLLSFVAPASVAAVLTALAETSTQQEGVAVQVDIMRADGESFPCQVVLIPLRPAPSCAFALLSERQGDAPPDGRTVAAIISRLSRGIGAAVTSQVLAESPIRADIDLSRLSSRELDVVSRLMAGDRVPIIAKRLFLSEGTVRNLLSAVYGKFEVNSQAGLIELLRPGGR